MKKKKRLKILIFIAAYFVMLYLALVNSFGFNAEAYQKTFRGVEYRNNSDLIAHKNLELDGTFSNPIVGQSRFIGQVTYDERSYQVDLRIKEGKKLWILDEANYTGANAELGYLFTDSALETVTLVIFEYDEKTHHKGWNNHSGLIYSADAETKEEAKVITVKNLIKWDLGVEAW